MFAGDVIVALGGAEIGETADLQRALGLATAGQALSLAPSARTGCPHRLPAPAARTGLTAAGVQR